MQVDRASKIADAGLTPVAFPCDRSKDQVPHGLKVGRAWAVAEDLESLLPHIEVGRTAPIDAESVCVRTHGR